MARATEGVEPRPDTDSPRHRLRIAYLCQMGPPNFLADPLPGPALHVLHVVSALRDRGHAVTLAANVGGRPSLHWSDGRFHALRAARHDGPLFHTVERGVRRVQSTLKLPYIAMFDTLRFVEATTAAVEGCDVIIERAGWMGYGGALLSRRLDIPLVLEVNGDPLSELEMRGIAPRGMQRWLSSRLFRWAIAQAALVVATGEGWRDRYVSHWGAPKAATRVVPNGSAVVNVLDRTDLGAFSERGRSRTPVAVYLGSLETWQGLFIILDAVDRLVDRQIPIRLLIIGDGPLRSEIEHRVRDRALTEHVVLTGALPTQEMARKLATADIGISAYCGRDEFSGLKLLDYKAAALAVVASGRDGEPPVIDHGRNGLIVPPCDADALADALVSLCTDPGLTTRLGRAARIDAERFHGWDQTARELERVIMEVVH